MSSTKPDRTLDCIGLFCPEPVFRTRLELDAMKVGDILEVFADDPAAEEDIKSLVKRTGNEIIQLTKDDNSLHVLIRKLK